MLKIYIYWHKCSCHNCDNGRRTECEDRVILKQNSQKRKTIRYNKTIVKKKVSKTLNNHIQTRQLVRGEGEIWDMSKKFTFDSRCYRRKNKSLSGILYTWKRVQPWYHSLALVWNRRIETSQIIHTRRRNLCNQI